MHTAVSPSNNFPWDRYRDTTVGRYLMQQEYSFLQQLLSNVDKSYQILDVACGSGRTTIPLSQEGATIVGADLSFAALQSFQRRYCVVPLIQSDSHCLPFPAQTFDCIVAIQSFEYFDSHQFLQECHRVLRPNGLLIFDFINRNNYKRLLMTAMGRIRGLADVYKRDCKEVSEVLVDHHFQEIAKHGYNWIPFHRQSNSRLVEVMAKVESTLALQRLYALSPWLLVAARKQNSQVL